MRLRRSRDRFESMMIEWDELSIGPDYMGKLKRDTLYENGTRFMINCRLYVPFKIVSKGPKHVTRNT